MTVISILFPSFILNSQKWLITLCHRNKGKAHIICKIKYAIPTFFTRKLKTIHLLPVHDLNIFEFWLFFTTCCNRMIVKLNDFYRSIFYLLYPFMRLTNFDSQQHNLKMYLNRVCCFFTDSWKNTIFPHVWFIEKKKKMCWYFSRNHFSAFELSREQNAEIQNCLKLY